MEVPVFCGQNPKQDSKNRPNCLPRAKFSPSAFAALALVGQFCSLSVSKVQSRGACQAVGWVLPASCGSRHHPALCARSLPAPLIAVLLGSPVPDTSGAPWAAPAPGKSTAGPSWGLYCQSISRVRPRVKRLGQGWSPCTAHSFTYLDLNMKQVWLTVHVQFLESIFTWPSYHFLSQASRNEWETRARVDLAGLTFFFHNVIFEGGI